MLLFNGDVIEMYRATTKTEVHTQNYSIWMDACLFVWHTRSIANGG